MEYVTLASGIYLTVGAFTLVTNNIQSAIFIRGIPGLIGVGLILNGAKSLGII